MASESGEEVTLSVPPELDRWLEERASALGVDRGQLLVELLGSYRELTEREDDVAVVDADAIEATVEETVAAQLDAQLDELREQLDAAESEFQTKLEDVRERVIQVKHDAEGKASADHDHEVFERIDAAAETADTAVTATEALEDRLDELAADLEALEKTSKRTREQSDDRLAELEDRLKRVAWAVSDLREDRARAEAVEQLKRDAAEADVSRATCENCGNGVEIGLLTEPKCPQCDAAAATVEPATGWFGSPRLVNARQLEAGDTDTDD